MHYGSRIEIGDEMERYRTGQEFYSPLLVLIEPTIGTLVQIITVCVIHTNQFHFDAYKL